MRRSTGILALLLVLAGVGLWADRSCRGTDDLLRARTRLYPGFERSRVQSVSTAGETWTSGPRFEAIVAELEFGRLERRLSAPEATDRRTLGFDPPRVTLAVREQGGATRTFAVGADVPSGKSVYVARDRDPDV